MKRNLFHGVFIILSFFFSQIYAQVIPPEFIGHPQKGAKPSPSGNTKTKKAKVPGGSGEATDVVTLNLTSLSLANVSLRYEHRLKGKLSAGLGAGYVLGGLLPNLLPYESLIPPGEAGLQLSAGEISGFSATPELRLYPFSKRGAPYGFYISLFGRYFDYDWKVPYIGAVDTLSANGTFSLSGIGGGTTLGVQFLIKNRFVIDWYITGGGLAKAKIRGEVSSPTITEDLAFYEDIGADMVAFYGGIPGFNPANLMVDIEKEKATFELNNQLWPIFRLGLSIGIAF